MMSLLAERLMGHPIKEHISSWMERGQQLEAHAVRYYEFQTEGKTIPVGFVTNDSGTVGASPDRFVGEKGTLEIKCPSESTHMAYLLTAAGAYSAYKVQVQGQLWISEREWTDVVSYHPELPEALFRAERDEKFIETLSAEVLEFSAKLEKLHYFVIDKGYKATEKEKTESMFEESLRVIREEMGRLNA